ncbi:MAG: peptidylprolyl isomerase, partial [Steroidobacter sp.]
ACFYARKYDDAVTRFDEIANDKLHPLRTWAAHSAIRAIVRNATLDDSLLRLRFVLRSKYGAGYVENPDWLAAEHGESERRNNAYSQVASRVDAVLKDQSLVAIHAAAVTLKKNSEMILVPQAVFAKQTAALNQLDRDFDESGELFDWAYLSDSLFDRRENQQFIARLRQDFESFDWIRTIQGCTDNVQSPNYMGHCNEENNHALNMWMATRKNIWLLAALMTASKHDSSLNDIFAAASEVSPAAMEYPTVRYNMIRLMRLAGNNAGAIKLLQSSQLNLAFSRSAMNLLDQQRFALATTDDQLLGSLFRLRAGGRNGNLKSFGADGDALINRSMSVGDLWRLSQHSEDNPELRKQLLVAVWWRAEMLGNGKLAKLAADQLLVAMPELISSIKAYNQEMDSDGRHLSMAMMAAMNNISPMAGRIPSQQFGQRKQKPDIDWWCTFDSADYSDHQRIQRSSNQFPAVSIDTAGANREMMSLKSIGTSADWVASVALRMLEKKQREDVARAFLEMVIRSETLECMSKSSSDWITKSKKALGYVSSEDEITEDLLQRQYSAIYLANRGETEYEVAHILVRTEEEAWSIINRIHSGEKFEQLARELTMDGGSRNKGGSLGWVLPKVMLPSFSEAMQATKQPGIYEKPVKTQLGWHVVQVTAERSYEPPKYEDVRASIIERLKKGTLKK